MDLKKGKEYLLEKDCYSRFPTIAKVKVLEVTKTAYKLLYESGNGIWVSKDEIKDTRTTTCYMVREQL